MFDDTTLGVLDVTFFCGSLTITVLIGLYFANKNKTFADYAQGGGNQNLWAVSASMAAGYCSAITLIGNPSELYMHGTSFTVKMSTVILAWPISSFVFLPVFKLLDGVSIFQYIECRFNPQLRRFVSLLFILQMTFYSAVSLYLPSLPLFSALKIPESVSIGFIGLVCIIYCSFGGIKAVTWTNFYHSILLLVSMITIIIVGTIKSGGFEHVLSVSLKAQRFSLGPDYFNFDLTSRHTIYNTIFGYTLVRLFLNGTNQMQVQSALSLSTLRKSQMSQLLSGILYFILQVIASAIGLILLVNYENCDPHLNGEIKRQDELLMHYLHKNLKSVPILQGMFIAAVFGSTLTTMSSNLNSNSSMIVEDFVKPFYIFWKGQKLDDRMLAKIGKLSSILLGSLAILISFQMNRIGGLLQATTTIYGAIGIPILSVFVLGTMTKFVNSVGAFVGLVSSMAFGLYVLVCHFMYKQHLNPTLPVSTSNCPVRNITTHSASSSYESFDESNQSQLIFASMPDPIASPLFDNDGQFISAKNFSGSISPDGSTVDMQLIEEFGLGHMSYLWLPLFTMLISIIISSLVSLVTGGTRQSVDQRLLAPMMTKGEATAKSTEPLSHSKHLTTNSDMIAICLNKNSCETASDITINDLISCNCCNIDSQVRNGL